MKKNYVKGILKVLLTTVVCCGATTALAVSEVNVEQAGTLSTLLPASDSELKVTGCINGTDIKYLRELITSGGVTSLDLSEVKIQKGGVAYYEDNKTENNVIGVRMFHGLTKLKAIELPASVTAILSNAFSNTGIRKVDIPNSVSQLGSDAFAYCSSLTTVVLGKRVAKMDQGVFWSSPISKAYVKPLSPPNVPAYLFGGTPTVYVYSEALTDYKASDWKQFTLRGKLEDTYPMEDDESDAVNKLCSNFFEDAACTQLKADCLAMSDDALTTAMTEAGMPEYMTEIAVKVKNGQWAAYEQEFRIHSYAAFSDAAYWNTQMKSTGGSYMGNPTGIYSTGLEPLYVFVDDDIPADATLYIAGCVDNDLISNPKTGTKLKKGLNIVDGVANALYYILYTADTKSKTKMLSEWPSLKIHIEGGVVNGYYDVARHSDTDYQALLKAATHTLFTIKGGRALFNFKKSTYKTVWPKSIERSICWFDSLTVWQKELMGYTAQVANGERSGAPFYLTGGEDIYPTYYNNPNFAIEGTSSDAGYANSTPYRTCYNSVECIRNSFVIRWEMDDWCSAHECGHNNQGAINLEGGTEASNNLFSNYIRFHDGLVTSVGSPLADVMDEFAYNTPFFIRNVNSQLRMYWQLYLYYHLAQKNTSFYPNLFKALRDDPIKCWGGGNVSSLKFVRKVCEVAQEDLTDFFTAWGFFVPMTNYPIEDYGDHKMTVRKADIEKTLAEIAKYPVKNREILFVEDRADYVLTTDFLTTGGKKRRDSETVGQCGELGQFTSYLPGGSQPSSYTYLQADSLFAMEGSGGVGFIMLDCENKMVYAANAYHFCIPSCVDPDFTIYSMDAGGTLHEVEKAGEGAEYVYLEKAGTLDDSLSQRVIKATIGGSINGSDFKYMHKLINESNLASIDISDATVKSGGMAYYESYRTANNVIGDHLFYQSKQLIAIQLPKSITRIQNCAFSNTGLKDITIPDGVTAVGEDAFAYCKRLARVVIGEKVKTLAKGAFYNSEVKDVFVKPTTPPAISSYLFSSKPRIHVYKSALSAYKASDWAEYGTIIGDLDDYDLTPVQAPRTQPQLATSSAAPVYDLFGRRVTALKPNTIYVRNGRKFITTP